MLLAQFAAPPAFRGGDGVGLAYRGVRRHRAMLVREPFPADAQLGDRRVELADRVRSCISSSA